MESINNKRWMKVKGFIPNIHSFIEVI